MTVTLDYLALRNAYSSAGSGEAIAVTMSQLASLWYCTPRNAKLLIKKMEQAGWLSFTPGVGRGNASSLTFHLPLVELLVDEAQRLFEQGEWQEAVQLLETYGTGTNARQQFWQRLASSFGYAVQTQGCSCLETLRFPTIRPIQTLDPAHAFYAFDIHLVRHVFDTLVDYDQQTDACLPRLAHAWEANADGTRWFFYLRKGVRFHHGTAFSANDVVRTVERLQQLGENSPVAWLARQLGEARVLDPYTVMFQLEESNWLFPRFLAHHAASIVAEDISIGTGPFQVTKWQPAMLVLEAHDSHFAVRPQMDRIEIVTVPSEQQAELEAAADVQLMVETGETGHYHPSLAGWQTERFRFDGASILTINQNLAGSQQHPLFRKALSLILDRKKMVEELGGLRYSPASGFTDHSEAVGLQDAETSEDPRQLLTASGYQGEKLVMSLYSRHAEDARWIKKQCDAYGISLELHVYEWQEMQNPVIWDASHFLLFGAVIYVKQVTQLELLQSRFHFIRRHLTPAITEAVDQHIAQLLAEPSPRRRDELMQAIERLLVEQHALLFLMHSEVLVSYPPAIKGVRFSSEGWIDFSRIWFPPQIMESKENPAL